MKRPAYTQEQFEEIIRNSEYLETKKDKKEIIELHKQAMIKWLDGLKEKLNNYKPTVENMDERRKLSPSFNYSKTDLKGEIWKKFPLDKDYTVSNFGRIKYKGIIQKQKDEKSQYVTLADDNLRHDYVYNFVAYTFLGKTEGDGFDVHHITNDGYFNTEDNLVLLNREEHSYVHGFVVGG